MHHGRRTYESISCSTCFSCRFTVLRELSLTDHADLWFCGAASTLCSQKGKMEKPRVVTTKGAELSDEAYLSTQSAIMAFR